MKAIGKNFKNVHIDALEEGDAYTVKGISVYDTVLKEETGIVTKDGYRPLNGEASYLDEDGYSGSAFREAA